MFGGDLSVGFMLDWVIVYGLIFSMFNIGGYFSYGLGYFESSGG